MPRYNLTWSIAPISEELSILDAVQGRAVRLIADPKLSRHLQPLSRWRVIGDVSLLYRYSNEACYPDLSSRIPPPTEPIRCTQLIAATHSKAVFLHKSRSERSCYTFFPGCSEHGTKCQEITDLLSLQELALFKVRVIPYR
nr:unnamed protein product [Callosobruchus chinensis]